MDKYTKMHHQVWTKCTEKLREKYTTIFFTSKHVAVQRIPCTHTHTRARTCMQIRKRKISKRNDNNAIQQNMKFKKQNKTPIFMRCEASWTINNKRHCCQRLIPHNASSHPHWQRRVCKECKLQYENHVLLTIVSLMKQTHPRLKDYIHNTYNRLRKGRRVSMNKGVCCKTSACKC